LIIALIVWIAFRSFIKIDKGYRGVVWSKFTGTKEKIYKPGYHFFFLRSIPPFFKLYQFPDSEKPVSEKIIINLPYKKALIHAGNFSIEYRVILNYSINDSYLTHLSHNDNYSDFKDDIKRTVVEGEKGYFRNQLFDIILNQPTAFTKKEMFSGLYEYITSEIRKRYGGKIKILSLRHTLINMPDIEKYRIHYRIAEAYAREKSTDFVKKMIELNYQKKYRATLTDIEIKRIKKYMKLMEQGHDILPFLFMEKLSDKLRILVLPEGKKGLDINKYFEYLRNKKQKIKEKSVNEKQD
jgi:hypothetical protein